MIVGVLRTHVFHRQGNNPAVTYDQGALIEVTSKFSMWGKDRYKVRLDFGKIGSLTRGYVEIIDEDA